MSNPTFNLSSPGRTEGLRAIWNDTRHPKTQVRIVYPAERRIDTERRAYLPQTLLLVVELSPSTARIRYNYGNLKQRIARYSSRWTLFEEVLSNSCISYAITRSRILHILLLLSQATQATVSLWLCPVDKITTYNSKCPIILFTTEFRMLKT